MSAQPGLGRPRWGFQVGLFQWRRPAFWVFFVTTLLCTLLVVLGGVVTALVSPIGFVLSVVLLAVYAIPAAVIIVRIDPYEREPRSLLLGAFLWGATTAILFSVVAQFAWGPAVARVAGPELAHAWLPALLAPPTEELYKALGVVLLYLIARTEFDDLMDGFVYGAMVGLGFTVVEDLGYFYGAGQEASVAGILVTFYVRTLAGGLYGHVLYTGLAGLGIAYFVTRRADVGFWRRLLIAGALFGVALLAHFVWNAPWLLFLTEGLIGLLGIWLYGAFKALPFLIVLILLVRFARRREARWLAGALETEAGRGGVTADAIAVLADRGRRRRMVRDVRRAAGSRIANRLKALHREQIKLAMVATRVNDPNHPDLVAQRDLCAGIRSELSQIPAVVTHG